MTARPAFGDFLTAARGHVSAAVAGHQADRSGEHVQEVTDSLLHMITVMGRYLQDIAAVPGGMESRASPPLTAWARPVSPRGTRSATPPGTCGTPGAGERQVWPLAVSLPASSTRRRWC
jgi:hypothetical protein